MAFQLHFSALLKSFISEIFGAGLLGDLGTT